MRLEHILRVEREHSNEDAVLSIQGALRGDSPRTSWCSYTNGIISIIRVCNDKGQDGHNKWIPRCDSMFIWFQGVTPGSGQQELSFIFWFSYLSESIYFKQNLFQRTIFLALHSSCLISLFSFSLFFQVIIPSGIYISMCGNVKPPWVWKLVELVCKAGP